MKLMQKDHLKQHLPKTTIGGTRSLNVKDKLNQNNGSEQQEEAPANDKAKLRVSNLYDHIFVGVQGEVEVLRCDGFDNFQHREAGSNI